MYYVRSLLCSRMRTFVVKVINQICLSPVRITHQTGFSDGLIASQLTDTVMFIHSKSLS